jgi:hypothetical protein
MAKGWFSSRARKLAFSVSPSETDFDRRGFHCRNSKARKHLELIGRTAVDAFNLALEETHPDLLCPKLEMFDRELWGYAYEGAAMAFTVLDCLTPWRRDRIGEFLAGPAAAHIEIVHVGIGFSLARMHRRVEQALPQLDPIFGWLAVDGYGFHEGYYHWSRYAGGRAVQGPYSPAALRVFDQGLGRSLWFTQCADVESITAAIADFSPQRCADLWSGVGLACAYAGGVGLSEIEALRLAAGPYKIQLAQGASFAAKARQRGGNPTAHTSLACEVFCGKSADQAAAVTDEALARLLADGSKPDYESLQRLVRSCYEPAASPMIGV